MYLSSGRIAAGILLGTIAIYAMSTPVLFHYFAALPVPAALALPAFQGMCFGGFFFGSFLTGTAWYDAHLKRLYLKSLEAAEQARRRVYVTPDERMRLVEERHNRSIAELRKLLDTGAEAYGGMLFELNKSTSEAEAARAALAEKSVQFEMAIAELRGQVAEYEAAIGQWENAYQEVVAERDEGHDGWRRAEELRAERDRLLAEISQLRRGQAQSCALPDNIMSILKNLVALPVFEKAVLIGLHPDRAKGDGPERERQRILRDKMFKRFLELAEYLREH